MIVLHFLAFIVVVIISDLGTIQNLCLTFGSLNLYRLFLAVKKLVDFLLHIDRPNLLTRSSNPNGLCQCQARLNILYSSSSSPGFYPSSVCSLGNAFHYIDSYLSSGHGLLDTSWALIKGSSS